MTTTVDRESATARFWEDERRTEEGLARMRAKIGGLSCSLCSGAIERSLGRKPGVGNVAVSLVHEQALIDYDPERVSSEQILKALHRIGFAVADPRKARDLDAEAGQFARQGRRVRAMAVLGTAAVALMLWEMAGGAPGWVAWAEGVLAGVAVFTVVRHVALLRRVLNRRVMMASALGGLGGGVLGLAARPDGYPTAGFFAASVLVVAYRLPRVLGVAVAAGAYPKLTVGEEVDRPAA